MNNNLLTFFENSIFFRIMFSFIIYLKNSSFYNLINQKIKINPKDSFFSIIAINIYQKIYAKLYFLKYYFDKIISFCLNNASKKAIFILLLFIITNEFFRNNILAEIFFVPSLIVLFLILAINFINLFDDKKKLLTYIFLIFFFIKIFYFFGAYNFIEFSDEQTVYSELSWKILKYWFYDDNDVYFSGDKLIINSAVSDSTSYYDFIAMIYYLFGKHFIIAKLFNLFIHLITGILVYSLAKELFDKKTAIISTILFYSLFSINLFSIAVILESFSTFLLVLFFLLLITLNKFLFRNNYKAIFIVFLIYLVYLLENNVRDYIAGLLPLAFLAWAIVYSVKKCRVNVFFKNFSIFIFIILILFSFLNFNEVLSSTTKNITGLLEKTDFYRNIPEDTGRLEFFQNADVSTIHKSLKFLPIGLTYVFFSVLPSEVKSVDLLSFFIIDTTIWYFLLFFIFLGTFYAIKNNPVDASPIITFIILAIIGHALVEGNFGNLLRHAVQFKTLMLIFGAYGIDKLFQ
ncbi:hypothetical protein COV11_01140 [Candidatus Woesearchaeota archaeon CG10_big_fil_rev_8_21_14_0_10_30_7]|nr:MAG: hypothetical protein COV11_01140 [Candidatus Woesearchaeota archaeon CG10_big_fil_rev_8_21_14_0_10_30_7]